MKIKESRSVLKKKKKLAAVLRGKKVAILPATLRMISEYPATGVNKSLGNDLSNALWRATAPSSAYIFVNALGIFRKMIVEIIAQTMRKVDILVKVKKKPVYRPVLSLLLGFM